MSLCPACSLGLNKYECERPNGKRCKPDKTSITIVKKPKNAPPSEADFEAVRPPDLPDKEARGGPVKDNQDVTDPKSTGRKRAAVEYPIEKGVTLCEWTGLTFAGGGEFPIMGCTGNFATNRHHGPDKDTLNNGQGNVHRICAKCHNRWHARNDPGYVQYRIANTGTDGVFTPTPHDATTVATADELYRNELFWEARK